MEILKNLFKSRISIVDFLVIWIGSSIFQQGSLILGVGFIAVFTILSSYIEDYLNLKT